MKIKMMVVVLGQLQFVEHYFSFYLLHFCKKSKKNFFVCLLVKLFVLFLKKKFLLIIVNNERIRKKNGNDSYWCRIQIFILLPPVFIFKPYFGSTSKLFIQSVCINLLNYNICTSSDTITIQSAFLFHICFNYPIVLSQQKEKVETIMQRWFSDQCKNRYQMSSNHYYSFGV